MKKSATKPRGSTSYRETAFGIIPRSKLIELEIEGTRKGLEYIHDLAKDKIFHITPIPHTESQVNISDYSLLFLFSIATVRYSVVS